MEQDSGIVKTVLHDGHIIWHYPFEGDNPFDDECIWHCEHGPALYHLTNTGACSWWLDDVKMDFEEWCELLNKTDEEIFLLRMTYL